MEYRQPLQKAWLGRAGQWWAKVRGSCRVKWGILYRIQASAQVPVFISWLFQWSLPSPKTEATRPLPAILPEVTTVMLTLTLKLGPCHSLISHLHTACHLPGLLGTLMALPVAGLCSTSPLWVDPTPLLTVGLNLDHRFWQLTNLNESWRSAPGFYFTQ